MKIINILPSDYGHFRITTTHRNKDIHTITTNTQAIDRYRDTDISSRTHAHGYTRNQAANTLYNEIVRANSNR